MRSSLTPESEFESSQAEFFCPEGTRSPERYVAIDLPKGAVKSRYIQEGECIQIIGLAGAGWITLEGDPEDYALESGEASVFNGPGILVIEGLQEVNSFILTSL